MFVEILETLFGTTDDVSHLWAELEGPRIETRIGQTLFDVDDPITEVAAPDGASKDVIAAPSDGGRSSIFACGTGSPDAADVTTTVSETSTEAGSPVARSFAVYANSSPAGTTTATRWAS